VPDAPRSELARDGVHILVLWAFAVAQPIFTLLAGDSEFFAIRGSGRAELVLFAFGLVVVAPLPLMGLELLASLGGERFRKRTVHYPLVGLLISAIALPLIKRLGFESGLLPVGLALLVGGLGMEALRRWKFAREYASLLAAVLVIFPAFFLLSPGIRRILFPPETASAVTGSAAGEATTVVFVILDELPTTLILNREREIDAERFPGFAELASSSTWYPNATTVADVTVKAIPPLVTGRYPKGSLLPFVQDYPENLFTLLAGSYRMHVSESSSQLCPPSLCEENRAGFLERTRSLASDVGIIYLHILLPTDLAGGLPPVTQNWKDFGEQALPGQDWRDALERKYARADARARQFLDFIEEIEPGDEPTLHFIHVALPHAPVTLLPSGSAYPASDGGRPARAEDKRWWIDNQEAVDQAFQRHLLQTGYADALLGRLIARLREVGLYDRSLLLVSADHGIHFGAGNVRRRLTTDNFQDVLPVPVFIKEPFQTESRVDDRALQTIDLLPTLASYLRMEIPWEVHGVSALEEPPAREITAFSTRRKWKRFGFSPADLERRFQTLGRQIGLFGTGDWERVYRLGPYGALVGQAPEEIGLGGDSGLASTVNLPMPEFDVDLSADLVPALVEGELRQPAPEATHVAVVVNGRVGGVGPVVRKRAGTVGRWSAMVDQRWLRDGSNRLELYLVEEEGDSLRLRALDGAPR
jgi:hypothetical protein